jgi:hypothetical protein
VQRHARRDRAGRALAGFTPGLQPGLFPVDGRQLTCLHRDPALGSRRFVQALIAYRNIIGPFALKFK